MSNYVWQRLNARNHNHYICEVFDKTNPNTNPVWATYFDGTQSAALSHFSKIPKVGRYMKQSDRYDIFVRSNCIQLNWIDE